jgi:hypothetical protein
MDSDPNRTGVWRSLRHDVRRGRTLGIAAELSIFAALIVGNAVVVVLLLRR